MPLGPRWYLIQFFNSCLVLQGVKSSFFCCSKVNLLVVLLIAAYNLSQQSSCVCLFRLFLFFFGLRRGESFEHRRSLIFSCRRSSRDNLIQGLCYVLIFFHTLDAQRWFWVVHRVLTIFYHSLKMFGISYRHHGCKEVNLLKN